VNNLALLAALTAFVPEVTDIDLSKWPNQPRTYFLVGVALERADDNVVGTDFWADQLIGATAMYRTSNVAFGGRLLVSPDLSRENVLQLRALAGIDVRLYREVFGLEWSLGIGGLGELRLADHFWVAYITPLELGVTAYDDLSFSVRIFAGIRYLATGELINLFLVDPNGFDNENARDALIEEKDRPFEGFVRIVFQRRVE
jgi:hypothetical protein